MIAELRPELDRTIRALPHADHPSVLLVVGVNGTGKTTTVGKLARVLVADGRRVVLGAADTFRPRRPTSCRPGPRGWAPKWCGRRGRRPGLGGLRRGRQGHRHRRRRRRHRHRRAPAHQNRADG
ncbi:SRP54-type, GTPase domain protein [Mycobacterium xenopi 4042]|uniref:SRP54-type, GTPase domain protein n=1 Tax=Mycobacterium xenopi 4042 TaxID=1299334 RepID=X8E9C6_MYCXE|nr:SRP54-type, GTPase domain protein [Mycobacterium xenopi 4042]